MQSKCDKSKAMNDEQKTTPYEAPELTLVGAAAAVILGAPGIGCDGLDGMSESCFEFESDEEPA